jgi:hypothetical protein
MPSPFSSLRVYRAVLTASYAGTLSLQSSALPPPSTLTFTGHDLSALSATYVPHPLGSEDKRWVASGGMDRVGRVWEYTVRQTARVSRNGTADAQFARRSRLLPSRLPPRSSHPRLSTRSPCTKPRSPLSALALFPRPPLPPPRLLTSSRLAGMVSSVFGI